VLLLSGTELLDVPGRALLFPAVIAAGLALIVYVEFQRVTGRRRSTAPLDGSDLTGGAPFR
jgi:hypothetical protein